MNWFRVYHDIIDDPKVLSLPRAARWHIVELFAVTSRQTLRGSLPSLKELAIHMRLSLRKTKEVIQLMIDHGFIDESEDGSTLAIHGWDKRQFKSDDVNDRVKRFRNVSETAPRTCASETETEQKQKKTPRAPRAGGTSDVFDLPPEIPPKDWADWLAMRKAKRAPTTVGAMAKAVKDLQKLQADGQSVADVLQQSTLRGWTGLFPVALPFVNGKPGAATIAMKPKPQISPEEQEKIDARYR